MIYMLGLCCHLLLIVVTDGLVPSGRGLAVDGPSGLSDVVSSIVQTELGDRLLTVEKVLKAEVEARMMGEKQLTDEVKRGFQVCDTTYCTVPYVYCPLP